MAKIPAWCLSCGSRFACEWLVGGRGKVIIKDTKVTCPNCGKLADIVDGTYEINDAIRNVIQSSGLSLKESLELARIIQKAQKEETSGEELGAILDRELPKASGLKKFLTDGWNLPFVLTTVMALLFYLFPRSSEPPKKEVPRGQTTTTGSPMKKPTKRATRRKRGKSKVILSNPNKRPTKDVDLGHQHGYEKD